LGMCAPDAMLSVSMASLMMRGVGIKYLIEGDSNPQEFIPRLASLYKEGKFPFDRLVKKYPFDQINEAAHASETGEAIKPVLVF
jgi:Zn-dependent alcohol dehydrogenase